MYIRTKNRIYEVESTLRDDGFVKGYNVGEMAFITKNQVIAQSENLEELCDGFYIDKVDKFGFTEAYLDTKFNKIKAFYLSTFDFASTLYGFIKTNNGLVYVAKLNKKGKLELL